MKRWLTVFCVLLVMDLSAQPTLDSTFRVTIDRPFFDHESPKVLIDEAHNNYHKKEGGLYAFTRMMEDDGAQVFSNTSSFTEELLNKFDVLIIVNAIHESNLQNWQIPCPSAFTDDEIDAVVNFIIDGGSLLLVADHMPMGGAVEDLAARFGVEWSNSFAMRNGQKWPPSIFERKSNTIGDSPVTIDSEFGKRISFIGSFTGSAFKIPDEAQPFLIFDDAHRLLLPEVAWKFSKKTKNEDATGWFQGACLKYGLGRIVFLAEAAMITAQLRGKTKIGMNSPDTPENAQLALNIFRYLADD